MLTCINDVGWWEVEWEDGREEEGGSRVGHVWPCGISPHMARGEPVNGLRGRQNPVRKEEKHNWVRDSKRI